MTTPSQLTYTPLDSIPKLHAELKQSFLSGKTRDVSFRKRQISALGYLVQDNVDVINKALKQDLGRPELESFFLEVGVCITDTLVAYKNVSSWAKTITPAPFDPTWGAMKSRIQPTPKGVVLIIVPFNFPLFLTISPLLGALAAGNCVVIKLPESVPAFSSIFQNLIEKYLDPEVVRVVQGAIPETTALLNLRWDHILYTGSGRVGKIVATAAAKHLTPVTLELGGQNPVFLESNTDLVFTARRLLWARAANAGQVCLCPEYVLVPRAVQDRLCQEFVKAYDTYYPNGAKNSDSFTSKLVNQASFNRVKGLLEKTKGKVVVGGDFDESTGYVGPTVLRDVPKDDIILEDEVFGPILSLVPVDSLDEALEFVQSKPIPLALYIFSDSSTYKEQVMQNTRSGSVAVNEFLIQNGAANVPFGGVGESGYGPHRGKYGFDVFSHQRVTLDPPKWLDKILSFRYPPYTASKLKRTKMIAGSGKKLNIPRPGEEGKLSSWSLWVSIFLLVSGALAGYKLVQGNHLSLIASRK